MKDNITMSLNPLVNYFKKSPKEFTKADMIKYVEENNIPMVNFHYVAGDSNKFFPTANAWTDPTFSLHSSTPVPVTFM